MRPDVAAIAIGRNEGQRLAACLQSLAPQVTRLIYVDSGSTDDSVAIATAAGAQVVHLPTDAPFTAARARNAGFAALGPEAPPLVQFVDGDCAVAADWIATGAAALDRDPGIGIVTGWRTESDPDRNAFHALAELEWHRPPGDIPSCGGDMMLRSDLFRRLGGFNGAIVASEDEELCLRVRRAGLRVHRLPQVMTIHDINMTRFGQWWQRTLRSGHGFAEIGGRYPEHFRMERLRVWVYGGGLPVMLVAGLVLGSWPFVALPVLGWAFNFWRTDRGLRGGVPERHRHQLALYLTLAKLPNMIGMLRFYLRRLRRTQHRLIEYK